MKTLRIVIFSPLALFRLIMILVVSGYVVAVGWIWLKLFGFSLKLQQWVLRNWGKGLLFFLGIRVNVNKPPVDGNFILMPNHRSYLDIFIVARYTPSAMVAKAEIKKWPFGKTGPEITNAILVDRSEIKSMISTMNKIKSSVKQGIPVTLFPEGTTFKGPRTKPFKNGSFKIAADTGIPIVPLAIHYLDENDAWVDDDTFVGHVFRQMGKPITRVWLRYGEPITGTDYTYLKEETKKRIEGMLNEITTELNG